MRVNLNKDKFSDIEGAFTVLKEDPDSNAALQIIKKSLEESFGCEFDISVIGEGTNTNNKLFVMSVYPEMDTITKVIQACSENKSIDVIKKLWETNKKWTIEIDGKILDDNIISCTEKELTAMILHEVGHIICSNSIPTRISLILRYEIAKSKSTNKILLKDKVFSTIMSLPILDACISDGKRDKSSIKEEIKADKFVKKLGYQNELLSVLTKLSSNKLYPSTNYDKMKETSSFSLQTLQDFQDRRDNLVKSSLLSLKESCQSVYINNVLDDFIETVFEDGANAIVGSKLQYMHERADKLIEDNYYTEFFIFKKSLKRIDPAELDYIDVRINEIRDENDKMMLISYVHSKLDIVNYYIDILSNPKTTNKYKIPHSLDQLLDMRKRLYTSRDNILKYKIPERNKNILVSWPSGYEG